MYIINSRIRELAVTVFRRFLRDGAAGFRK
jgi:hypothetical protein